MHEIKDKNGKSYEKFRWIIQSYNNHSKQNILTQFLTIQRISQRLIIAITITIIKQNYVLKLRNITQIYPQLSFELNREIFARLPKEFRDKYPRNTIIQIIRPFYGIAESDVYWWFTYHKHHLEEFNIVTSTYDSCLLITSDGPFGITGI
jgi:hypothetical protein